MEETATEKKNWAYLNSLASEYYDICKELVPQGNGFIYSEGEFKDLDGILSKMVRTLKVGGHVIIGKEDLYSDQADDDVIRYQAACIHDRLRLFA